MMAICRCAMCDNLFDTDDSESVECGTSELVCGYDCAQEMLQEESATEGEDERSRNG